MVGVDNKMRGHEFPTLREKEEEEEMSISKIIVVIASIYLAEKKKVGEIPNNEIGWTDTGPGNLSSDWLVKFAAWDFLYLYNKLDIDTESKTITEPDILGDSTRVRL